VLWFGDPNVTTPEGNISEAKKNLDALQQDYTYYDKGSNEAIKERFPWIASGMTQDIVALFCPDGGTIDIKETVHALADHLFSSKRAIIKENTEIAEIIYSENGVAIHTSNHETYHAKKVILTPGVYVNHVLDTLKSSKGAPFPDHLSLTIYLWTSAYYQIVSRPNEIHQVSGRLPRPSTDNWPVWIYFGKPVDPPGSDQPHDLNSYYGFPSDVRDAPFDVRVCPGFTSRNTYDFIDYPPEIPSRTIDDGALGFNNEWVKTWFDGWADPNRVSKLTTCVAGFATKTDGESDPGQGFVMDILPGTHNNVVLCTGGWAMKFVPLFGRILADLAVDGSAPDYDISHMKWDRGINKPRAPVVFTSHPHHGCRKHHHY